MAFDAGTGVVHIVADTSVLNTQVASGVGGAISRVKSAIASAGIAGAFLAIGAAAAAGMVAAGNAFVELGSEVRGLQRVTGLAAEEASRLLFVGKELGVTVDKMSVAFGLLAKNIVNASGNFTKYGIETQRADGTTRSLTDILGQAADKYVAMGGGIEGAAFAMNVFGRSGKTLIPLLARGSAGLKALADEAEKYGVVLSQDDVDATKEFAIAQRSLGEAMTGLAVDIGREVLPIMEAFVEGLTEIVLFIGKIPGPIVTTVGSFLVLTGVMAALVFVSEAIVHVWATVFKAAASVVTGNVAVAASSAAATTALTAEAAAMTLLIANSSGVVVSEIAVAGATDAVAASATAATVATGGFIGSLLKLGGLLARSSIVATGAYLLGSVAAAAQNSTTELRDLNAAATVYFNGLKRGTLTQKELNAFIEGNVEMLHGNAEAFKLAVQEGISYSEALEKIGGGITALSAKINGLDLTEIISSDTVSRLTTILPLMDRVGEGVEGLGGSFDSVKAAFADLITNAKANAGDFLEAMGKMKDAVAEAKQGIVDAFGGASGALEQFIGKTNVSADRLFSALAKQKRALSDWGAYFQKIHSLAGVASDRFLEDMQAQGLKSIGIMQAVADMPKKQRDQFIANYNAVNSKTESVAGVILNTLVPAIENLTHKLINMQRRANNKPVIDFDTGPANAKLDALIARLNALAAQAATLDFRGHGRVDLTVPETATGGIVTRPSVRLVGEAGPEAIIPLSSLGRGGPMTLRILDWRTGLAELDSEMSWIDRT